MHFSCFLIKRSLIRQRENKSKSILFLYFSNRRIYQALFRKKINSLLIKIYSITSAKTIKSSTQSHFDRVIKIQFRRIQSVPRSKINNLKTKGTSSVAFFNYSSLSLSVGNNKSETINYEK